MVGAEDEDCLLETMKELPQKRTVTDLQEKGEKLKEEVKWLKEELEDEKKANAIATTKLNESLGRWRASSRSQQKSSTSLDSSMRASLRIRSLPQR